VSLECKEGLGLKYLNLEINNRIAKLTINRPDKHNAFDDVLLESFLEAFDHIEAQDALRVVIIEATGINFCAGADLNWMRAMAQYSEVENEADALKLARVLYRIATCSKPTIASVQGQALGGGVGIIAACDFAIGSTQATFCFSELKLGLIPAVISPYVIKSMGQKAARHLFLTAKTFDAKQALDMGLLYQVVDETQRLSSTLELAHTISQYPPLALKACKKLLDEVANRPINETLIQETAKAIAIRRVSEEGQAGLNAFLNKEKPYWA
jgi:methylglutaconyl-CoA hydratase